MAAAPVGLDEVELSSLKVICDFDVNFSPSYELIVVSSCICMFEYFVIAPLMMSFLAAIVVSALL